MGNQRKDFITLNKNNFNNTFHFGNYRFDIDDKKLFLDAYKKVLIKNENNIKRNKTMYYNGNNKWIQFKYHHPGKYREFNYKTGGGDLPKKKRFLWLGHVVIIQTKMQKDAKELKLININGILNMHK